MRLNQGIKVLIFRRFFLKIAVEHFQKDGEVFQRHFFGNPIPQSKAFQDIQVTFRAKLVKTLPDFTQSSGEVLRRQQDGMKEVLAR